MTVKFSSEPDQVCCVERLDDDMIDDIFYQDEEIEEFRYFALMVECGLAEDDVRQPEVEPIASYHDAE